MPTPPVVTPFQGREGGYNRTRPVAAALIAAAGIFLLLPLTTLVRGGIRKGDEIRTVEVSLPPPPPPPMDEPPPEPEPPPESQPEPEPIEPQQLSLAQMELALNPGFGDAMAGGFHFESFASQSDASTIADLEIFDVRDLDKPPARIKTVPPTYPLELKRARVQGTVVLLLIIDQDGRVTVDSVVEADVREFIQPAIAAAEQCIFESPTRGGQKVRARYTMRVPFRL